MIESKKAISVEAWQFTKENVKSYCNNWLNEYDKHLTLISQNDNKNIFILIETAKGYLVATEGDFIVRDKKGNFYQMSSDDFNLKYYRGDGYYTKSSNTKDGEVLDVSYYLQVVRGEVYPCTSFTYFERFD